ncbi:MAG: tetratricopeptide repeat protein [Polyangiaceae bacterium]
MRSYGPRLLLGLFLLPAIASAQPRNAGSDPAPTSGGSLQDAARLVDSADYDAAEKELSTVRGPEQTDAQLLLARAHFERGRWSDAEKILTSITQPAAKKASATILRARILAARGQVGDALKLLAPYRTDPSPQGRRARIHIGEWLIETGKRSDADAPLHDVIGDYGSLADGDAEGLLMVGRAAHLLRSPKDANQALTESERADKGNVETLLVRARLFLEKFDPGHAEEVTRDALKKAPKNAEALLMMARIRLEQAMDFDAAEALVAQALAVNPKLTGAYAVRAGIALRDMEIGTAEKMIATGLTINPNDLELLSLKAAARFLADDSAGFAAAKKEVFTRNPEYSTFYTLIAPFGEWEHRYDDIVAWMKDATKIDPDDSLAWAELGLNAMRGGNEADGLTALQRAWTKDHFNVRVYNTLNLYEKTLPVDYETISAGALKIRLPKAEKPLLQRYMPSLVGNAWASMKARYGFVPEGPVQVELYENREHFSVRTSGLPNIGIQGVCFGRVVASMSPHGEVFNWGNVLWHELGHVFAIQLSKSHVPRWFTEGLSEYETIAKRPEWSRELDPQLYRAIVRKTLPPAVDMNRAFTHASDGLDVTVAYYAASQMLLYTVESFGMPRVTAALKLWGEGARTADVIQKAFGVSATEYDTQFRNWFLNRAKRYRSQFVPTDKPRSEAALRLELTKSPKDASLHAELALALMHERKEKEAEVELAEALKLDPKDAQAMYISVKRAAAKKDTDGIERGLSQMRLAGHDGYFIRMAMADLYEVKKDSGAFRHSLEAAARFDPTQPAPLQGLYDLAVSERREDDATDVLRKLAPLEQHDPRVWRLLLKRLLQKGAWEELRQTCEAALFVDIASAETHLTCAKAHSALKVPSAAIFEAESALLASPKPEDAAAAHELLAKELRGQKREAEAAKHDAEAARLKSSQAPEAPAP